MSLKRGNNISPFIDEHKITSICPVLGQVHAQIFEGLCPRDTQNPLGKYLQISFIGSAPFVVYDPIGGSEFLILGLLAKKFQFIPKFVPEQSYDIVHYNGTTYGMTHTVSE